MSTVTAPCDLGLNTHCHIDSRLNVTGEYWRPKIRLDFDSSVNGNKISANFNSSELGNQ